MLKINHTRRGFVKMVGTLHTRIVYPIWQRRDNLGNVKNSWGYLIIGLRRKTIELE